MKIEEKNKAITLRRDGLSINQIATKTGASKASVSLWVRDIELSEQQKERLSKRGRSIKSIEKRRKNRLYNEDKKRREKIDKAKGDINNLSSRDLKIIGSMLYWGEGGKGGNWSARLSNSDPDLIRVIMRFFREICNVPEKKFRAHIHTFEGANVRRTEIYWSKISRIPKKQFYKTYIKRSSASLQKRKTLPYGTIEIYVHDTNVFLAIKGWMEKIKELLI
jgi:hypothetical protein